MQHTFSQKQTYSKKHLFQESLTGRKRCKALEARWDMNVDIALCLFLLLKCDALQLTSNTASVADIGGRRHNLQAPSGVYEPLIYRGISELTELQS